MTGNILREPLGSWALLGLQQKCLRERPALWGRGGNGRETICPSVSYLFDGNPPGILPVTLPGPGFHAHVWKGRCQSLALRTCVHLCEPQVWRLGHGDSSIYKQGVVRVRNN